MNAPQDPRLDAEGYVIDPDAWDETLAAELARAQGIELGDDHWFVIRFMRDWYQEHRVSADARHGTRGTR